jgi:WS/DGAT/MGAT family acyltransferase
MSAKSVQLTPVDAAWLHMEDPTNLMMITGVMLFAEKVDFERVKETYRLRLLPFERFRQRIVESDSAVGLPHWELDPSFDLDAHCHHVALPDSGSKADLIDFLSDVSSTPLDFSKPLWQVHVVDNVMGGSAIVMRIHHSIGDGTALVAVTIRLFDDRPDAPLTALEAPAGRKRGESSLLAAVLNPAFSVWRTTRSIVGTVWQESAESLLHPSHVVELARSAAATAAVGATTLTRALLQPNDPVTPFKGKLGVKKRVAWSEPIQLAEVKAIGQRLDAKVNDVLVAAMTGALRHYLLERHVPIDGIEIHSVIPVDLRSPEKALNLGNVFGMVFLGMPVGIADPVERLREVKVRMDRLKQSGESLLYYSLLNVFGLTPKEVEEAVVDFFGARATAVFTNVVGPRAKLYLAGVPVENVMFWVPQSGRLGMGISIYSYDGRVTLGVITDAGLVPDPEKIAERFNLEFGLLLETAGGKPAAASTKTLARRRPLTDERPQCAGHTKNGSRCRNRAAADSQWCHIHKK